MESSIKLAYEDYPLPVDLFVCMCDDAIDLKDLLHIKKDMLSTVGHQIEYPLSCQFLCELSKVIFIDTFRSENAYCFNFYY